MKIDVLAKNLANICKAYESTHAESGQEFYTPCGNFDEDKCPFADVQDCADVTEHDWINVLEHLED